MSSSSHQLSTINRGSSVFRTTDNIHTTDDVRRWNNDMVLKWVADELRNNNEDEEDVRTTIELIQALNWKGPSLLTISSEEDLRKYLHRAYDAVHEQKLPIRFDSVILVLWDSIEKLKVPPIKLLKDMIDELQKSMENQPELEQYNITQQFRNKLHERLGKPKIEELSLETVLSMVDKYRLELHPPASYTDAKCQAQLLGNFNNPDILLPIYHNQLEMNFVAFNEKLWRQNLRDYVTDAVANRYFDIHMRISGTGKTTRILALGTKIFLVYITCSSDMGLTSKFIDESYRLFLGNLNSMDEVSIQINVRHAIKVLYLSKLLVLHLLLEWNPDLTPIEYLKFQFNGDQHIMNQIYETLRSELDKYSENAVQSVTTNLLSDLRKRSIQLGFAIDEASVAEQTYHRHLISLKGKRRSLLTLLIEESVRFSAFFHHYSIAGTSMTLKKVVKVGSAVGKSDIATFRVNGIQATLDQITNGTTTSLISKSYLETKESVEDYVKMHVAIDGCTPQSLNLLSCLTGRLRNSSNLVRKLSVVNKTGTKDEALKQAIDTAYESTRNSLVNHLYQAMKDEQVRKVIEDLIVVSAVFMEYDDVPTLPTKVDLLELGVCEVSVKRTSIDVDNIPDPNSHEFEPRKKRRRTEEYSLYSIREPAALDACIQVAKQLGIDKNDLVLARAVEQFEAIVDYTQKGSEKSTEKGKAFEKICFSSIAQQYPYPAKCKLSEVSFVQRCLRSIPKWMTKVDFYIRDYGSTQALFHMDIMEYFRTFVAAIKKKDQIELDRFVGYLIMPPNEMHPDGLLFYVVEWKLYMIVFSAKLYTENLPLADSHLSTMVDRFFMEGYKTAHPKPSPLRDELLKLITPHVDRILRVHVHASQTFSQISYSNIPSPILKDCKISGDKMHCIDIGLEHLDTIIQQERYLELIRNVVLIPKRRTN